MYRSGELFMRSLCYFGVYYNRHQNNTRVHEQFVTTVHTLYNFLHDIINPYMTIKNDHQASTPSLLCLCSADDITIYCWWRHSAITRPDNCDANTWKSKSNSLDIDFIHGHIHDQSYKNLKYTYLITTEVSTYHNSAIIVLCVKAHSNRTVTKESLTKFIWIQLKFGSKIC